MSRVEPATNGVAASTLSVEVAVTCPRWRQVCPSAASLAKSAAATAYRVGADEASLPAAERVVIGVTLADDPAQRRLNADWRGKDVSTNVLAFPVSGREAPPPGAPLLLGDVVLALETVAAEAAAQHKPLPDHLRHLVVHGVLHLLGRDHQDPSEAEAMERLETSILARLGVPDPYCDII